MPDNAYWDSCLFIEILEKKNKDRLEACEDMHAKAQAKPRQLIIVTSALTIVEVNKFSGSGVLPEKQRMAHHLTRTHGLMPADAIHVATALLAKVPVLYTYDGVKKRRKGLLRHDRKIGAPPLRIEIPPKPIVGPLFESRPSDSESAVNEPDSSE